MNLSSFGEKIKAARIEKNFTLEKLSEKLGISRNFLWEIEAGRKAPAIQTLYKIGKELNISIDYLLDLSSSTKWLIKDPEEDIGNAINKLERNEIRILYKLLNEYLKNKTF